MRIDGFDCLERVWIDDVDLAGGSAAADDSIPPHNHNIVVGGQLYKSGEIFS